MRISTVHGTFAWDEDDDGPLIEMVAEQSVRADRLGFAAVIFPEKHFSGYMPPSADPLMSAAYLAPQLEQAYLGFAILAPAYFNPANVLERLNLLDHYAKGRLLLAIGSGFEIEAMAAYGVSFEEIMGHGLDDFLEVAERLWAKRVEDPPVSFETTYHRGTVFERVVPKPYSPSHPRFIGAGVREHSIARAARNGWPVFIPGHDGHDNFKRRLALYRSELVAADHPPEVLADCMEWTSFNYNGVLVADTDAEAERLIRDALQSHVEAMDRLERRTRIQARALDGIGGDFRPFTKDFEGDMRSRCLYGSPDTVAAELERFADLGVGNVLMSFNMGVYTPERRKTWDRSLELFAAEVLPRVSARVTPTDPLAVAS
jgi:alkanesulfonate monooxygenase SsuD/methylene tetrahydromethanopterin reductase-like flavin-dependent oxidoreductase (luciferase family)